MRRILRELRQAFPDAAIETTGSNHYRLRLPNGRIVIVASRPGCRRFLRNTRATVRRMSTPTESKGPRP